MKVFLTFDLLIRFTTRAGIDFSNNSRLEGFSGSDCMFQVPARLHYNLKVYWYLNVIPVMRRIFGDIPNSFSKYRGESGRRMSDYEGRVEIQTDDKQLGLGLCAYASGW